MAEQFVGSGWSFPLRIGPTGGIALVSGEREIEEAIRLVLATAPGERPMRPEFGCAIHDLVFAPVNEQTAGRIQHEVYAQPGPLGAAHRGPRRRGHRRRRPERPLHRRPLLDPRHQQPAQPGLPLLRHPVPRGARRPRRGRRPRKRPLMSLPSPNLDDRRFQQFVDDAKRYIQQRAPEWTDHNVSDPGRHPRRDGRPHGRPDRLPAQPGAGEEPPGLPGPRRHHPLPAVRGPHRRHVLAVGSAGGADAVPVGTEVATLRTESEEAVVFATERELTVVPCALRHLLVQHQGEPMADRTHDLAEEDKDLLCFAESPSPGDAMLLGLTAAVPHCAVALELDSRVDGVGVDPRQPPLVWEAWTADGWQPCEVDRDGTGGLNRPGEVVLHVPGGHVLSRNGGQEAGWLRCRVTEPRPASPSTPPRPPCAPPRHSRSAAPPAPCTPRRCTTRRSASPPGCRVSGCGWCTPPWSATTRRYCCRPPSTTAGRTGRSSRTSRRSGPYDRHITLDATTGEIAFGPAVREPDGIPAAVRDGRPQGRPRPGPPLPHAAAGARATWRAVPYRSCAPPSRTSPRSSTARPRAAAWTGRRLQEAKVRAPITPARPGARGDAARLRGAGPPRRPGDRAHHLPGGRGGRARGLRGTGAGRAAGRAGPRRPAALRATRAR